MRIHDMAHRSLLVPAVGLALAAAVTACSSSSSSSSSSAASSATAAASSSPTVAASTAAPTVAASTPAPSPSASGEAVSGPAAIAAIKKTWTTFFNGKTSAADKVGLVQNGQNFVASLDAAAKSSAGATAGATVQSVTITSKTGAKVDYTITISGTPMLAGQKGVAVYQDGTWKVGDTSFCGLLALENSGKTPAACK
jgi:hypothetical protein